MDSNALKQAATAVFNTEYRAQDCLTFRVQGVLHINDFLRFRVI